MAERILIVEDERVVAWDIQEALERCGYTVVATAASAASAVEAATEHTPDLVLMDIRLSGEQDGILAATDIYQRCQIPVIFLTAHADTETLERATAMAPFGYLVKPFQGEQLHIAIQVAVQRHRQESRAKTLQSQLINTLQSLGEATIALDLTGNITFMNALAEDLTGWQHEQVLHQPLSQMLNLLDGNTLQPVNPTKLWQITEGSSSRLPPNCLLLNRSGTAHYIADTTTPIRGADGTVIGNVIILQDASQRQEFENNPRQQMFYDGATGLPSQDLLLKRLGQSLKYYRQSRSGSLPPRCFALLLVHLDQENWLRATQTTSEQLLREVSQRLSSCLRAGDTVARWSEYTFAVLVQQLHTPAEAEICARRLHGELALPLTTISTEIQPSSMALSLSIGIAPGPHVYKRVEDLVQAATTGLRKAQQAGGNCSHQG